MQQALQIPLGGLPVHLVLVSDASVAFVRVADFKAIIDRPESQDKMSATFDGNGFQIGETEFKYDTRYFYKELPEMLQWLQEQRLEIQEHTF